jgi:hypothetical protein
VPAGGGVSRYEQRSDDRDGVHRDRTQPWTHDGGGECTAGPSMAVRVLVGERRDSKPPHSTHVLLDAAGAQLLLLGGRKAR